MSLCEWVCDKCGHECREYSGTEICVRCNHKVGESFKRWSFWKRLIG